MDLRCDREREALEEISRVLWWPGNIGKALTSVLNVLRLTLEMENGTVSLFDDVTGEVFIEAAPEMRDEERILGRFRPGEGIIGRIFASGLPAVIPDIGIEPLFLNRTRSWHHLGQDPCAFIGVPIRYVSDTVGVLTVDRHYAQGAPAFDRDVRMLKVVANLLAARVRLQTLEHSAHLAAAPERIELTRAAEEPEVEGTVAAGQRMRGVMAVVQRVARSRATVLLRGETGTGKEVVARALHDASPRGDRPFVAVNCAALNESLLESELFGHEKGAFTGATSAKPGRFETADGGTLFLDEVGELSLSTQVKLLRVLQERQFERVGGREPITVDVRIVAATNRDLEAAVQRGAFRLDFYHRLSVVSIELPPLRDRPEEIPALSEHFLRCLSEENGRPISLDRGALAVLQRCRWSGNVRQLRNCLERAVVTSGKTRLSAGDVCPGGESCLVERLGPVVAAPAPAATTPTPVPLPAQGAHAGQEPRAAGDEPVRIRQVLEQCAFVQAKAARALGMSERQLAYRVKKYGIAIRKF